MCEAEGRRIVAGVSGSLGSLTALHRAADEARRHHCELLAILAWEPPGGELSHRRSPFPSPGADFRKDAADRLLSALRTAFGQRRARGSVPGPCRAGRTGPRTDRDRRPRRRPHRDRRGVPWQDAPRSVPIGRQVLRRTRNLPCTGRTALSSAERTHLRAPTHQPASADRYAGADGRQALTGRGAFLPA